MKAVFALAAGLLVGSPNAMAQTPDFQVALLNANALVEAAVAGGGVPGAVMLVAVDGKVLVERAFGFAQLNDFDGRRMAAPRPMQTSTVFDLASVTKVMATTMAVMILADQKKIDVEAPVYRYLPDFRGPDLDKITV